MPLGKARLPKGKVIFVMIDGVGDVSVAQLHGLTPLEAAKTPYLDALAGLLDPVEPGLACGSDTAHMSIFGYEPRRLYRGRGALESMGAGLEMSPGDIAFKCNFACLNKDTGIVERRRADRNFESIGPQLCADLNGIKLPSFPCHEICVKYATEHRCGLVVHGCGLTDAITGTDPLKDNLPLLQSAPTDGSKEAVYTAALVNELSTALHNALEAHPITADRRASGLPAANVVLLRGCGTRIDVPCMEEQHGFKACMVAPTKIIAGLGMTLGIDVLDVDGATGSYNTALHQKARSICDAMTNNIYDFGFLHVKAVDDCGHDRNIALKVQFIESVDKMIGQLIRLLWTHQSQEETGEFFVLACTGDHSTPVVFGDHSHEPVPFGVAHLRDVVATLGGTAVVDSISLGPIVNPDSGDETAVERVSEQARRQKEFRKLESAAIEGHGDIPCRFNEVSAARGELGRFPGREIFAIFKQLVNVGTDVGNQEMVS